jgi:type IV pilus assembly protein PilC
VLVAESKEAAIATLRKQQIIVTAVTEKGKEFALPKLGGGISNKEIAIFTRQFSVMIDAGLPLVQCLEILGSQQENRAFQKILYNVRQDVESGSTLADALRKHPKAFDDLFCNMVAAGEAGGILDTILQRLSTYIEKIVKLRSAVRSALVYPVAVILIAVAVVWIILWKVIPTFATLFEGLGASLPLPTRITIALSNFIGAWWWLIFLAIGVSIFLLVRYHKTHKGRRQIDGLMLKAPVLGVVLRKIAVARFCRTLGTLVSSGVPDDLRAVEELRRLPGHGGPDGRRGRADRRPGDHAVQNRRLLRGRGGRGDGQPARPARAGHDLLPRCDHRRHRDLDVHADVRLDQQDWVDLPPGAGQGSRRPPAARCLDPKQNARCAG